MVAERAGLWRAAARTRNLVPALWRIDPRHAGPGIDIDDGSSCELRKIDLRPVGGEQSQSRQFHAGQMNCRSVVLGNWDIRRQNLRIMGTGRFGHFSAP
jgi:hypothetical protein